jgi:tryptophan-rich sensory protein
MMKKPENYFSLLLFVLIVSVVALSGMQFQPGEWYAQLQKPAWTPPNWVFAPVWTVLYLMIGAAGWLIFASPSRTLKVLWISQLILNGLWSWLFFGLHETGIALIDILAMLGCITLILALSRKSSRAVFRLMAPYCIWVGYASTLNAAIYVLNTP